jgi:dTDP-4-amino-4,6-dideoxygalactose transaminase
MKVKINIVRPLFPGIADLQEEFADCLASGMVTNNSRHVRKFEEQLQAFFSSKNPPVSFCNGEMALFHLIQAWKEKLGYGAHESFDVLVPSFTFSGTVNAIVLNNLRPVFCDIDETLTLCPRKIRKNDIPAKMIVAVGVYGNLPDIDELGKVAREKGMVLLFDNAAAFGSRYGGKFASNLGHDEIFSFHATKIFSSMEGGAAVVDEPQMVETLRHLRDFGQYEKSRGDVSIPGLNSKMQEISALVGLKNLDRIGFILESRSRRIGRYREFFMGLERKGRLRNMVVRDNVLCTYLYYPVILEEEATDFVNYMQGMGVAVRRYYTAVHDLRYYKDKYAAMNLDVTDGIKDRIVALPLHTDMSDSEIEYLFETVTNYFGGRS